MRLLFVTLGSVVLTTLVVGNAYHQKRQFYPSVVFLTKSNPSMAVLYLQALVLIVLCGKMLRKFFFGQLRTAEMEHLIERSWYAVTETCLAFTVFRDDFSPKFVAMFTLLLFLKSFHWLAEDRVDYMERSPVISLIFHLRVISLLSLLSMLDMYFIQHAYHSTLTKGASVQLVFGFEYAILLTVILMILVKYLLHAIDLQSENPWDNKAVYLLYTDILMGLIKVMLYVMFVAIMIKVHTFPLFVIRPMYLTMRSFKKALHDVVMSRRAIRKMNTLYPDATPEELQSSDNVCIICREEMVSGCKKLPCNHIFHKSCLRSWFQRQQTCPTCRMDILRAPAPRRPHAPFVPHAQQPMFNQNVFAGFPMWAPFAPPPPGAMPPPPPRPPATGEGRAPPASTQAQTANTQQGASAGPSGQPGISTTMASGAATTTTTTTGGGFTPTFMPGTFPGVLPGFPFGFPNPTTSTATTGGMPPMNPFTPYGLITPPPPPSFAGLTDSEVRAMEGRERQNVEARVTCLRNIQTLLDAAVLQMQQYTAVINSLSISTSVSIASAESSSSTTQARSETLPKSSMATSTKMSTKVSESTLLQEANIQPCTSSQPDSIVPDSVAQDSASVSDTLSEEQTPGLKSDDEELNEIRRRRLERFTGKNEDVSSYSPQNQES